MEKKHESGVYTFFGCLTLRQNALQTYVKYKIRNPSGWAAFHGFFNINLISIF